MLLALPTSHLILMLLSFAGMFGFTALAVWMLIRRRQDQLAAASPPPAKLRAEQPRPAPAAAPEPSEPPEITEFVALPGNREDDSPQPNKRARAAVVPESAGDGERTEFIPSPFEPNAEHGDAGQGERTEFIPSPLEFGEHANEPEPERTEFIPSPLGFGGEHANEPEPERTEFIPAPLAFSNQRPSAAAPAFAPPSLASPSSSSVAAPPVAAPPPPIAAPLIVPPPSVAAPPVAAPSVAASSLDRELDEHLELAAAALAQLEVHDDEAQLTTLHGHLEVLASAPIEALLARVRPALEHPEPTSSRAHAAWLALLLHKTWPAKRALPELLAELDDEARREGLRALASWDDPRAQSLAAAGLAHSQAPARRREWLELFADNGWDPGEDILDQALSSSEPELRIAGLRLLGDPAMAAKASAHMFTGEPAVRVEAIEAALVFGDKSAWLLACQCAYAPAFPGAAELLGLLGSADDLARFAATATASGSTQRFWGLSLAGRPGALGPCVAAFDQDDDLGLAAKQALALVGARKFDSGASARAWLDEQTAARLIGGSPRTLDALVRALAGPSSPALRRAIARELRVRSGGRVRLNPNLHARAWRRQLADLATLNLDLDADYPWPR